MMVVAAAAQAGSFIRRSPRPLPSLRLDSGRLAGDCSDSCGERLGSGRLAGDCSDSCGKRLGSGRLAGYCSDSCREEAPGQVFFL